MKYTVIQSNIEKISICLNRGRDESVGNDVDFGTFIVQSYFDTLFRYALSVASCGAVVSVKVMDQNFNDALSAEEVIRCV